MTKSQKNRLINKWFQENQPIGQELGYPDCCIKEFCNQPPELMKLEKPTLADINRFNAGNLNGDFTGFIPCKSHSVQIITREITLESLINNRSPKLNAFPNA